LHKKIFSSAGYLAAASLIEKIGAFIIIPILTVAITSNDYGSLMLAVSYVSVIILFIYNGLHSALFRWYSMWQESFDKELYEKYIFYIVNIIGFFIICILLVIHTQLYNLDEILKIDFYLFILVLLSSISVIGFNLRSTIWIIENKAYRNLIFMFIKTILLVGGVYLFIDIYPYASTKPIIEIIVVGILSLYFIYSYIFKYPPLASVKINEIKPVLKESFVYGWGLQISQIAFWVISSSDRIMLANLTNNEFVAYYSILMIGITVMFIIVAFNNSFSAYYNKMISDNLSMKEINKYIFTYLLYGFLAIMIYKLFLYYFSDNIILILSTKEYLVVSSYMYLTSDILLFYFAYLLFSRYLHAYKMVKAVIFITIISAMINVGLNYILIQEYGILGALMGSIVAYLSMGIISFILMYKEIEFIYMKNLMILFILITVINFMIDIMLYKGGQ
jgi:O-antigen/teichoic acid export membrane protein